MSSAKRWPLGFGLKVFMWVLKASVAYCESVGLSLTHWVRMTHICVINLTIIGSDNGLSPGRRQAIFLTNAGILLIGPLRINFSEILIENYTFSFKKMHWKMSSGNWRPFCLGLSVLTRVCHNKCQSYLSHFRHILNLADTRQHISDYLYVWRNIHQKDTAKNALKMFISFYLVCCDIIWAFQLSKQAGIA